MRLLSLGPSRSTGFRRVVALVALGCALAPSRRVIAQNVDSAKVGARMTPPDSARKMLPKPPISPRRAFLYSLVLPGYSQAVLNRPTAGALFVLTEGIAIAMLRESSADLREARRFQTDSLVVIGFDPETGVEIKAVSAYTQRLVDTRRSHVEDWIAFILANHLFAAADGYVAAHLWDLPTQISVERRPAGMVVAAKLPMVSDATVAAPVAETRASPAGNAAPIGVFDSGLGGLTVAHAIMHQLPSESLVYFGDTARVPYGPKSPETVLRYSREVSAFLLEQGVKAIVVACNTATAHALPALREELDVPVIGVVEPGARAAVRATRTGHIGVIGTAGTIRSQAYVRAIHAEAPDAHVTASACPLFVPLVEEGWTNHVAAHLIAEEYLRPLVEDQIDTLVLGCTHYPLLKPLIGEIVGRSVRLIDSAEETAADTRRMLDESGLAATDGEPSYRFISSDDPQQFLTLGRRFFGGAIERVEVRTFG